MRRMEAWLLAATLALAGCIGAVAQGTPAMENRDRADEEAYAVDESAELISITGAEANESLDETGQSMQRVSNATLYDETIGDGGPPFWAYEYRTANGTYEVVVAENGTVVDVEREDAVRDDTAAIDDWQVTSIEAVEIVQENNASWEIDDDGLAFYALEQEDETSDPVWTMGLIDEDGIVVARVNATTGEFLGAHPIQIDLGGNWGSWGSGWSGGGSGWGDWGSGDGDRSEIPPREGDTDTGELSITEDTQEHSFEIDAEDHPDLGVTLELQEPQSGTVELTVDGPDGELGTLEAGPEEPTDVETWSQPEEGSYTMTAELTSTEFTDGVEQAYEVSWCAEGQPAEDDDAEDACERVRDAEDESLRLAPLHATG